MKRKIGFSKNYANLIYDTDILYVVDGKNLQVIPENKKINLDRCISDVQGNIVYFYSGSFMNRLFGIAQLNEKRYYNRENETSSILKTKRAKTLFFSLPFFSQKRQFFPMFGELERI